MKNPQWGCRLKAVSLVSLHTSASTLLGAVLLGTANSKVFAAPLVSQTNLPRSGQNRSIPTLEPPPTFGPANPIPPLGYPQQVTPSNKFNIYRLGRGDTISVVVQRFPDLSFTALINNEGNIVTPLLGAVPLLGLTLEEAQERLRVGLNRYVINPNVTVTLAGQRPVVVTLTGEVLRPGFYPLAPNSQILAALQVAGGATTQADLRSVTIRRTLFDGSVIEQRVDLFTPLQNGQPLPDLRLQDGDAVILPKLDVATQQDYDRTLVSKSTLSQPTISIRVLSYANQGIANLALPNGSTFLDALSSLGASSDNANLRKIGLIRFDPTRGKAVTQYIDGKAALLGDVSQNVPLQNNDVIVVGRSLIGKVTYALQAITQPFQSVLSFLLFFNQIGDVFNTNNRR